MAKCLNPIEVYICGTTFAKDGVLSPKMVFSYHEAIEYYYRIFGSHAMAHDRLMRNNTIMPCGKCALCLKRKRKDMVTRIQHERSMVRDCCFITLTYDDINLPMSGSNDWKKDKFIIGRGELVGKPTLLPSDVQKFLKRLRRHLEYKPLKLSDRRDHVDGKIRYFCVGEYGSKTGRPHYHLLIFGWRPSDLKLFQMRGGYNVYRSSQIEKLWKYGFSTVGDAESGVAAYCARYCTKKLKNLVKDLPDNVCPEFFLQSVRAGGIGATWVDKYYKQLINGFVTYRNAHGIVKVSCPKYYYDRVRKVDREFWLDLRDQKIEFIKSNNKPLLCAIEDIERQRREALCELDKLRREMEFEIF